MENEKQPQELKGLLRGDYAQRHVEAFFENLLERWWKAARGARLRAAKEGQVGDLSESNCRALWKEGSDPFCLYHGLVEIDRWWKNAREDVEKAMLAQEKGKKYGPTYTRGYHRGIEFKKSRKRHPGKKKRKPAKPGRGRGRPPKYKTEAEREAAQERARVRWRKRNPYIPISDRKRPGEYDDGDFDF